METAFKRDIGVTIALYKPEILKLYLKTFYQSHNAQRDIIVACSPNNTANVFQEVSL